MVEVILILLLITGIALFARMNEGSWLSPGAFFAMLWVLYIFCALFFVTDYDTLSGALLWVFSSCCVVHIGSLLGRSLIKRKEISSGESPDLRNFPYLKGILLFLTGIGLVELCFILFKSNFSPTAFLSLQLISEVSAMNRSDFGFGDMNQGIIERILFIFVYTAPLFGGVIYKLTSSLSQKFLAVTALLVVVLVGTLYGSRMGVLFGGSFWISGHMATHLLGRAADTQKGRSYVLRILFSAVLIISGLSLLVMVIRYQETSIISTDLLVHNFSDQFGFLSAFAQWFQLEGLQFSDPTLGHRTFGRTYELLGLTLADQYFYYSTDVGFTTSNIFTVFRDLIEDFTPLGALMCLFLVGIAGGASYRRVSQGEIKSLPMLTTVYVFTFTSFSYSLFVYTAPTIALIIFWFYFRCCARGMPFNSKEN